MRSWVRCGLSVGMIAASSMAAIACAQAPGNSGTTPQTGSAPPGDKTSFPELAPWREPPAAPERLLAVERLPAVQVSPLAFAPPAEELPPPSGMTVKTAPMFDRAPA